MRRRLTEEEHRLWAGATRSVHRLRPLQGAKSEQASAPPSADGGVATTPPDNAREASRRARAGPAPMPALGSLPRREKQRLARGRSAIEARIDLHGMTQAQAHAALLRFVQGAQAQGFRFVLVITGAGARGDAGERGVLRRQVPLWFELPAFRRYVLAIEGAHADHGGGGALYVRIRRGR